MSMMLAMVKIGASPGKRQEILDILLSVKGPTLAAPGCRACSIYEEYGADQTIAYVELWQSPAEMYRHIRSTLYSRILEAMELSASNPEISFHMILRTEGMELIENLRSTSTT
ncbi:putative quinol monooxygenase [Geotalea uraniireducens]|uniref:Antibiotic biosynthesis monooxygenase n=1 Tax=Geotalea uraniireducens (strain Rf4) TaxID=351605 RepID=A5G4X6_GEOUR|nr:antibiotic biosynthesis monooxygenase [Geotalea uraniireducens]ABQ26844.1 Antibiotic biosynthesis monooxygenase [Geotalea uraniireducens Rf4]